MIKSWFSGSREKREGLDASRSRGHKGSGCGTALGLPVEITIKRSFLTECSDDASCWDHKEGGRRQEEEDQWRQSHAGGC